MQYLKFLTRLKEAKERGIPLDGQWAALSGDERNYLLHNLPRLPGLGGQNVFLDKLAQTLGIDPKGMSDGARYEAIREKIDADYQALPRQPDHNGMRLSTPAMDALSYAEMEAMRNGNGKQLEKLSALLPAGYRWPDDRPGKCEEMLTSALSCSNGKAMRYFLNESPDKAEYRQWLKNAVHMKLGDEMPRFVSDMLQNGKKGQAFKAVLDALPPEDVRHLLDRIPDVNWKYGPEKAKMAMECYPREYIGPGRSDEAAGTRKNRVKDRDEVLFIQAASFGDSDLMRFILEQYPLPEQRGQLLSRDDHDVLRNLKDARCAEILCGAIPDGEREKITAHYNFISAITFAAESHNRPLYDTLTAAMPAAAMNEDWVKRRLLAARLMIDPQSVDSGAIRSAFGGESGFDIFHSAADTGSKHDAMLARLAEAMPEKMLVFVKMVADHNFSYDIDKIRSAAPDGIKAEVEILLRDKKTRESETNPNAVKWRRAFGDQPWFKEFKKLSISLERENPHGFKWELFQKLLPVLETACELEGNIGADRHAYTLATLFKDSIQAESYLNKFAARDEHQPIHDALLFDIPKEGAWNIEAWRQFALRDGMGPRALKLLPLASKIEEAYQQIPKSARPKGVTKDGRPAGPLQFQELKLEHLYKIAQKIGYAEGKAHPALAKLCLELGVDEEHFDDARRLLMQKKLPAKNTPAIHINGRELGFPGFHFARVKPNHPWCAFIGKMVNCCNYIGGHTDAMARAQIGHADCSLYVLTNKEGQPIAKCTGWMSEKGNLVFNAWERLSASYDKMCEPFLLAAAIKAMELNPKINRVTLGANKGGANFPAVADPEQPGAENLASQDATRQFEVVTRSGIEHGRAKLDALVKKQKNPGHGTKLEAMPPAWQQRHASSERTWSSSI